MGRGRMEKEAGMQAERTGIPINLVVDNRPLQKCFDKVEAMKNGHHFVEKTAAESLRDEVAESAKRMRRFF